MAPGTGQQATGKRGNKETERQGNSRTFTVLDTTVPGGTAALFPSPQLSVPCLRVAESQTHERTVAQTHHAGPQRRPPKATHTGSRSAFLLFLLGFMGSSLILPECELNDGSG